MATIINFKFIYLLSSRISGLQRTDGGMAMAFYYTSRKSRQLPVYCFFVFPVNDLLLFTFSYRCRADRLLSYASVAFLLSPLHRLPATILLSGEIWVNVTTASNLRCVPSKTLLKLKVLEFPKGFPSMFFTHSSLLFAGFSFREILHHLFFSFIS